MTLNQAIREAKQFKKRNDGLNSDETMEVAYSPEFCTVAMRVDQKSDYTVFNVNYPMHGKSKLINDWISIGLCHSKKEARLKL